MIIKRIQKYLFIILMIAGIFVFKADVLAKLAKNESERDQMFLKADGKDLKNNYGKGDIITLRGTNIGGWQLMESWMCPTNAVDQKTTVRVLTERFGLERADELIKVYENNWINEDDFNILKDMNFNCLRLPISYINLLDSNGRLRKDTLNKYDWFIEEAGKRKIYVILDLHAAPGSQSGRDHTGDTSGSILFTDKESQELTISLWEQLAEHYKGNPVIAGYDLLNEPEGSEDERNPWGPAQLPFLDRLYKAIRAIDKEHLIIINAIWDPSNMPDPMIYGWENVMYQYHFYGWDGIDDHIKQKDFTDSKIKNNDKTGHNVPVLIGEFNLFDKLQSWEYSLNAYEENGWSWTTWTYKTVGMGSWGIFNSSNNTTPKVDIYNDNDDVIEEKWSKTTTKEGFTKNKYLYDLLKVMADKEVAHNNKRKWYFNTQIDNKPLLRTGTDAKAELVNPAETYSTKEDKDVIKLTIAGLEQSASNTSRNVCISPALRNSIDIGDTEYLIINTYSKQKVNNLRVTLIDKDGSIWTSHTSQSAIPVAYAWEKVFVDLSKITINKSAIVEIRIGLDSPGVYYFDDIYFAQSYADLLPDEDIEEIKNDMGVIGQITDCNSVPESSYDIEHVNNNNIQISRLLRTILAIIIIILTIVLICKKTTKHKT
ncbi:MAG TPA: glycoside hydrolase family 5 protein [Clostridiales bacterium]|nr:glycoside hydrolase family 5 protein [Clostridiales bacterium]